MPDLRTSLVVLNMFAFSHIIMEKAYEFIGSQGESMLPTIKNNNDYLVISKFHRRGKNVKTGDIVSCIKPTNPTERVCKRVTAMAGDVVLFDPSTASILHNYEDYIKDPSVGKISGEFDSQTLRKLQSTIESGSNGHYNESNKVFYNQYIKIPEGHCWLTGDNLESSLDSRTYGVIPLALITGKVIASVYIENGFKPWTWVFKKVFNNLEDEPKK